MGAAELAVLGSATLSLGGEEVRRLAEPREARELLERGELALLMLDDGWAEQNGPEAVAALCRASRAARGPPVVLLAQPRISPELLELAWRAGIDDCILQPASDRAVSLRSHRRLHQLGSASPGLGRPEAQGGRVLVCGPHSGYREHACELLELSGYEVLPGPGSDAPVPPALVSGGSLDAVCVLGGGDAMEAIGLLSRVMAALRGAGLRERTHILMVTSAPLGGSALGTGKDAVHVVDLRAPVEALVERVNGLLSRSSMSALTRERVPFFCPVEFREAGGSQSSEWESGFSFNVSAGGVFVRTLLPPRKGSAVELRIRLTTMRESISATGVVRWANRPGARSTYSYPIGMGVAFLGAISPRLSALIEACRASLLPPRGQP